MDQYWTVVDLGQMIVNVDFLIFLSVVANEISTFK